MKIRKYFINNYIIVILIFVIIYGFLGYMFFIAKQYLGLFVLVILAVLLLNRRIVLYEDKIKIIQGYKKIEIEFDLIKGLRIGDYKPKFSKGSIPVVYAKMKDNKVKIFYYTSYPRKSMNEIIVYALKTNNMIKFDSNIKALIRNEESDYDIRNRKKEKQSFILMIIAIIITVIYSKLGK
ncbi:hypothetical protein [Clostridium beijerinckii]|uniref:hypothetical protein n=1 Tax=Clostridium beijerinckii TaxID=1520 RepID=UPI00098BF342|nr:hypothetical protein [Clostridium beijerinckii]NRT80612.1 hypothetical protein [Clostridium beijerinckii]OOM37117.1 hypothetical protein CBEIJ_50230 [Clostridium beijerinckii]